MQNTKKYLIIPIEEIFKVDFSIVCETSPDTVRKSVDGSKTFVKWDGEVPTFVADIVRTEGPYSHAEILEILSTPEWVEDIINK